MDTLQHAMEHVLAASTLLVHYSDTHELSIEDKQNLTTAMRDIGSLKASLQALGNYKLKW